MSNTKQPAKQQTDGKKPRSNQSSQQRQSETAPENHNSEQDDNQSQAQELARDAQQITGSTPSPTESEKSDKKSGLMGDSTQDLIDHMRDMESSGRIDMDAYSGEPNHDDDTDKYGKRAKP